MPRLIAALLVLTLPAEAPAQRRLTAWELGGGGLAALADAEFFGGAFGVARRLGGQPRVAAQAALGTAGGRLSVRAEASVQLLLAPAARNGVGLYLGVGLAWQGVRGASDATYLTALVGVEGAPGRRWGWYVESGLSGGIRAAAGIRWRHFPDWW